MSHHVTGTRDETYNLVSILYHALQGAETCEQYERDAGDDEDLHRFFQQAQAQQKELADAAKRLLRERLDRGAGTAEDSAFRFREQGAGEAGEQQAQPTGTAASEI
jgi:hypothetical protein